MLPPTIRDGLMVFIGGCIVTLTLIGYQSMTPRHDHAKVTTWNSDLMEVALPDDLDIYPVHIDAHDHPVTVIAPQNATINGDAVYTLRAGESADIIFWEKEFKMVVTPPPTGGKK